jgi:hypothetical protein
VAQSQQPGPLRARVRHRRILLRVASALGVAACVSLTARTNEAQVVDAEKAAKVKAAYVLNFVRYSQWPEYAFEGPDAPIVLAVVRDCDVTEVLAAAAQRSAPIGGRLLTIRRVERPSANAASAEGLRHFLDEVRSAHLVYICSLPPAQTRAVLNGLEFAGVLTVGDTPNFAAEGGMLGFVLRGDRIVFEANPPAIKACGVAVSAKVLKLAQIVESGER